MTFDIDAERARFEQAAMDHFHTRRQQGNVLDDNGCPITRESLFWRDDKGDYGVRMFNAAWWGWKEAAVATRKTCEVPTLDEAIRQAHWTNWSAEEHHVVAVSVRHLRLLANHNDAATPQAAAQPPAPSDTAITYMTGYSDAKEWTQTSQAVVVEPVYQYQLANGNWIYQTKESYDYNVKHGQATVRMLYATPQAAAQPPAPGEAAIAYMTGYSDGKERAVATSQAGELNDAKRLDWIRDQLFEHKWNGVVGKGCTVQWAVAPDFRFKQRELTDDSGIAAGDFRRAIDAAINAKGAASPG